MRRLMMIIILLALVLSGCGSFEEGYDLGRSDSVKELYWAFQELQREKSGENRQTFNYYMYEGQKRDIEGTNYCPHKIKVPVIK